METIWKYKITSIPDFEISLPLGANVLSIQMQNDYPTLWVLVDPSQPYEVRKFFKVGTGWPIRNMSATKFIATIQKDGLVWHYFEQL
jgi:hypothetical protein